MGAPINASRAVEKGGERVSGAYDTVFDVATSTNLVHWVVAPAHSNIVGQQAMSALVTNRSREVQFFRITGRGESNPVRQP